MENDTALAKQVTPPPLPPLPDFATVGYFFHRVTWVSPCGRSVLIEGRRPITERYDDVTGFWMVGSTGHLRVAVRGAWGHNNGGWRTTADCEESVYGGGRDIAARAAELLPHTNIRLSMNVRNPSWLAVESWREGADNFQQWLHESVDELAKADFWRRADGGVDGRPRDGYYVPVPWSFSASDAKRAAQ